MKRYLLLLVAILACSAAFSQERVGLVEFELGVGLFDTQDRSLNNKFKIEDFKAEVRLNIPKTNFDVGLHCGLSNGYSNEFYLEQIALFADYNLRNSDHIDFFAGVGVVSDTAMDGGGSMPIIAPRLGVELYDVARLTITSQFAGNNRMSWGVTLGVVLGGWKK